MTNLQQVRDEIVQHLLSIRSEFLASIAGLSEDQMNESTIEGWSPKDHVMHLAYWHELRASEVIRISAGYEHAWPLSVVSDDINAIVQAARARLSVEQAVFEYDHALHRVVAAISVANERGLTPDHYGEVGLRTTHDLGHAETIRKWRDERAY